MVKRAEVPVEITYNPKTKKISATGYWDDVYMCLSAIRDEWIKLERTLEKALSANIPFAWRPIKPYRLSHRISKACVVVTPQ